MKSLLIKLALLIVLGLGNMASVQALPFPDPGQPPLGPGDVIAGMPVSTFEGSFMASKTFVVPTGGIISFAYNFLTEEEFFGANDYFSAALLDPAANYAPVEFYPIADVSTSSFNSINGGGGTFGPHGSYFTNQTDVLQDFITISSGYVGSSMSLAFAVFDLEDGAVDSGVLIDNVSIVPHGDFSAGLLGPGGFIGQDTVGDDMYGGNVHLQPDGSLSGVTTTGLEGNYAYLSTGHDVMIPEPATLFLLGSGLLGIALRKRRK